MIINKNIMTKIVDKVALNQWKSKIKNVNTQYHQIFTWYDKPKTLSCDHTDFMCTHRKGVSINKKNFCECIEEANGIYNSKDISHVYCPIYGYYIKSCMKGHKKLCNYMKCGGYVPKKYYYSSGLNDPNGYKEKK